jgi:hypothetical protein
MSATARRVIRTAPAVTVPLGPPARWEGETLHWTPAKLTNAHVIVSGVSGSGKTHTLRKITRGLVESGARWVLLFDPHGDVRIPGLPCQDFELTEQAAFGLNPLRVDPDPLGGGPRRTIRAFVSLLSRTSANKLGARQVAALTRLLDELYEDAGFTDDATTWQQRSPNLEDLRAHVYRRMREMKFGGNSKTYEAMAEHAKAVAKLRKAIIAVHKAEGDDEDLAPTKLAAMESYKAWLNNLDIGDEADRTPRITHSSGAAEGR